MTESSGTVLKTGGEERHAGHDAKDVHHVDTSGNFLWLARLVLDVMHRDLPFFGLTRLLKKQQIWIYKVADQARDEDVSVEAPEVSTLHHRNMMADSSLNFTQYNL